MRKITQCRRSIERLTAHIWLWLSDAIGGSKGSTAPIRAWTDKAQPSVLTVRPYAAGCGVAQEHEQQNGLTLQFPISPKLPH